MQKIKSMFKNLSIQNSQNSNKNQYRSKNIQSNSMQNNNPSHAIIYTKSKYPITCYKCGNVGHVQKYCPKQKNLTKSQNINVAKNTHQSVQSSSRNESGLYINAKVNNISVSCLINTGATLTVISKHLYKIICKSCSKTPKLKSCSFNIATVSCKPINIKEKCKVSIKIKGQKNLCNVVVSQIKTNIILEINLMQSQNMVINLAYNTISVNEKSCKLKCQGPVKCYKIVCTNKIVVPSKSKVIIQGQVKKKNFCSKGLYVIKQKKRSLLNNNGIIAQVVVQKNKKVPVKLINISNNNQIIHPGTNIAVMSPVNSINTLVVKNKNSNTKKKKASNKKKKLNYNNIGSSPNVSIAKKIKNNKISCNKNNNRKSNNTLKSSINKNKLCNKKSILKKKNYKKINKTSTRS